MPKRAAVHQVLNTARKQLNMTERELWVAYRAVGGEASQADISAFFRGLPVLGKSDIDLLALVLNEKFTGESLGAVGDP